MPKISALSTATPANGDYVPGVDISDVSESVNGTTKRFLMSAFWAYIQDNYSAADLTALAAIAEASISDGDFRVVTNLGEIYVYDAGGVAGGGAVFPGDDGDATGVWVPLKSQVVNLSSAYHTGTLGVDYIGGDSGAGDPTLFLNEVGNFVAPTGSIVNAASDPASAPGATGVITSNNTGRKPWISFGTSVVGDWVRLVTFEDMELPADLATATITTADLLTFGDDSNADALAATTVANFITDLALTTATGTQTLTNKTLTNPKASYTAYSAGTKSSGTYTPAYADGNMQYATNGGAHTLAPQTGDGVIIIHYTNNGSAGAITTSGYSVVKGDAFTTTDTHEFLLTSTVINSNYILTVQAMQ